MRATNCNRIALKSALILNHLRYRKKLTYGLPHLRQCGLW